MCVHLLRSGALATVYVHVLGCTAKSVYTLLLAPLHACQQMHMQRQQHTDAHCCAINTPCRIYNGMYRQLIVVAHHLYSTPASDWRVIDSAPSCIRVRVRVGKLERCERRARAHCTYSKEQCARAGAALLTRMCCGFHSSSSHTIPEHYSQTGSP
jgi:hypothetical protein